MSTYLSVVTMSTFSRIHPVTVTTVDEAKIIIDKVSSNGHVYQHSLPDRVFHSTVMSFLCSPCVLWSAMWRCICCPVSCFKGNGPLEALFTDSGCTRMTDSCIGKSFSGIYMKKRITCTSDNAEIICYAAKKIQDPSTSVKGKYAIVDVVAPMIPSLSPLTPQLIVQIANTLT